MTRNTITCFFLFRDMFQSVEKIPDGALQEKRHFPMKNMPARRFVLLLIYGLIAIGFVCPAGADAEDIKTRINLYVHRGCEVDGQRLKPALADDGGAASFWVPRQRRACLDTIRRHVTGCSMATSFATNTDDAKYPECLPVFAAESNSCITHYESQKAKCDLKPESNIGSGKEEQELEDERERLALEEERGRLALEDERERLALQEERDMLEEEQRLVEARERQRLAEQRRERERRRLAEQRRLEEERERRRLAELRRERERQRLAQERRERARRIAQQRREQERLRAQRQSEADTAAAMAFIGGVLQGLAGMGSSGNMNFGSSPSYSGSGGGSCEQAKRRAERMLAQENPNAVVGMCNTYRRYLQVLQYVQRELASGGCPAHEVRQYDQAIAQTRQGARASCANSR